MKNEMVEIYMTCPAHKAVDVIREPGFSIVKVEDEHLWVNDVCQPLDGELEGKLIWYEALAVQYYAWKYGTAAYYGFCRNNEVFSFSTEHFEENAENWIWFYYLDETTKEKLQLTKDAAVSVCEKACFQVTTPMTVATENLWVYYRESSALHQERDLQTAYEILCEMHPECRAAADSYLEGKMYYPGNLFLASSDELNRYSNWLFPMLKELEKRIGLAQRSREGLQAIRDIGGYLMGIYYIACQRSGETSTALIQRAFIEREESREDIYPAFEEETAILLTASDYYVPYCAVTIRSILDHISAEHNYDIVIFQQDMTPTHRETLKNMAANLPNVAIRFYDPRRDMNNNLDFHKVSLDFGVTRFPPILSYRAFVPYILQNFSRIVWLDCDLVFEHDIGDLSQFDMQNKIAAFVHDIVICGFANGSDKTFGTYYSDAFIMKDIYQYGNAGVVVLDLDRFRKEISLERMMQKSIEIKHKIPEQDTINSLWEGHTRFLDRRWNVFTFASGPEWAQRFVPEKAYQEYLEARKDPYVIHFVGPEKPWNNPEANMAERFWYYARRSPFYEVILQRQTQNVLKPYELIYEDYAAKHKKTSFVRRVADFFFPLGTRRRALLKKALPKKGSPKWNTYKNIYQKMIGKRGD